MLSGSIKLGTVKVVNIRKIYEMTGILKFAYPNPFINVKETEAHTREVSRPRS